MFSSNCQTSGGSASHLGFSDISRENSCYLEDGLQGETKPFKANLQKVYIKHLKRWVENVTSRKNRPAGRKKPSKTNNLKTLMLTLPHQKLQEDIIPCRERFLEISY